MALFEITTADGSTYEIEAPEGTTDAQAYQYLQQSLGNQQPQSENAYVPLAERARREQEAPEEVEDTSLLRDVADVGTGFVSGIPKAAGAITSLGSLVPGLHYVADPLSAWLQDVGEGIDEALLSDKQKQINQELSDRLKAAAAELGPDAEIGDYIDSMISQGGEAGAFIADHPGQVFNLVASSLPYVFGGGAVTKGLKAGAKAAGLKPIANMSGITGAAVGEGSITAGEVTKNIIEQTDSVGDYSTDRLAAVPAGITTAGISLLSGRATNKAGLADIDTVITDKIAGTSTDLIKQSTKHGLTRKVVSGAFREGVLEEAPQSFQEKVWENVGTGEHPLKDTGGETVLGTAAGAGQGAGVNTISALASNSADKKLKKAADDAQEGVLVEKSVAEMDEQFIAEVSLVETPEDMAIFAENWGMTVEEVLADPKYIQVQQEKEAAAQEDSIKDLRIKHEGTFPDEDVWYKENDADNLQQQLLDIEDSQSELGSAFNQWRKDNDKYDKNQKNIKLFLDEYNVPKQPTERHQEYLDALDAHAQYKEEQAARTPEAQAEVDTVVTKLLSERAAAVKEGNVATQQAVEKSASELLNPAEWRDAKRIADNTKAEKPKKPKREPNRADDIKPEPIPEAQTTEPIATAETNTAPVVEPVNETTDEVPTDVDVKPKRVTKKSQARDRAAEALGEDFEVEYPELSQALEDGGVYPKKKGGKSKFDTLLSQAIAEKQNKELNTGDNLPDQAPVEPTALDVFSGEGTDGVTYSNNQKKVLQLLAQAAMDGNLDEYVSGKDVWSTQRIQKEAGLNSRQATTMAINQVKKKITEQWGEEKVAQALGSIKTKARTPKQQTELKNDATMAESVEESGLVVNDDDVKEVQADASESLDPTEYLGGDAGAPSMGVVASPNASQTNIAAPKTKEEKAWVEKHAEEKAEKEHKARLSKAKKEHAKLVGRVMGDKDSAEFIVSEWDKHKPEGATSFGKLPTDGQYVWINALQEAFNNNDDSHLTADAVEIGKRYGAPKEITKKTEAITNDEANSKPETKDQKVAGRQREADKGEKGTRDAPNVSGKKSTKTVSKGRQGQKVKATKEATKNESPLNQQRAYDYATEKLGEDWIFEHPRLMEMLKQKKFGAFNTEVDKLAGKVLKPSIGSEGNNASAATFESMFLKLLGRKGYNRIKHRVHFFDTRKDAEKEFDLKLPKNMSGGVGPVTDGSDHMIFIMEKIREGNEMAVFMHEVGGHIGMESILGKDYLNLVAAKIMKWAIANDGSQESQIARAAKSRIEYAQDLGAADDVMAEWVAYFLEEAVIAGVQPTRKTKAGRLIDDILKKFRAAFRKFLKSVENDADNITSQDLVDMAYGAAKMELGGDSNTFADGKPRFSVDWNARIENRIKQMFPKDEKGKYIPEVWLSKKEYSEFQKEQYRWEQKARRDMAEEVEKRMREAAQHEIDMKYSINKKENNAEKRKIRNAVRKVLGDKGVQHYDTLAAAMRKGVDHTKFLSDFIREHKAEMPSLETVYRAILEAEKTRNDIKQHVEGIAVETRNMSEERLGVLNEFIADSTISQKWGYDPELEGLKVKVDPDMQKRFDALTEQEQQVVRDMFAHGYEMIARMRAVAKEVGLDHKFFHAGRMQGPYAPLKRFGNYVTEMKSAAYIKAESDYAQKPNKINKRKLDKLKGDANHYVVSFFDTKGQATKFRDENRGKYASAVTSPRDNKGDGHTADYKVLSKVLGAVESLGIDPIAHESVKSLLEEMYFQSLDDTSARQSQTKREGVAGYEKNMVRSFLSHAHSEANLIAQMEHGSKIAAALAEAKKESKGENRETLGEVYNLMEQHYSEMFNGAETPMQDRIAALNTVYMLTSSVGYHLTNATQPMMVSIPMLAGDFNSYRKVWKELTKGYGIAKTIVNFNIKKWQAEVDIESADPKYRPLLEELQVRQLLDVGLEQDLSEFNRYKTDSAVFNKLSDKASGLTHSLYQVARVVEMYNRVAPAIAAYDMAMANPKVAQRKGMTPQSYAISVIQKTQGDFSAMGAPLFVKKANNRNLRLAVQYRKYQVMMGWAYTNAFRQIFDGKIPNDERAAGARTLSYLLMHAAVFSGVKGLPAISMLAGLVFMATGGDEPEDIERVIQRYVEDKDLATMISRGPLSYFGLDMSTKLSQDKIFHPLPYTDFEGSQDGLREAFFEAVLGPSGATASNFMRSYEYAKEGNTYRAVEYALPKGIRTAMESYRLSTEGYSLRNGDVPVTPEHFSKLGLVLNSLGIPATEVNKVKWTRGQQYELTKWFSDEQATIRKAYVKASKSGDKAEMKELTKRWNEVQDAKDRVKPFFNNDWEAMKRQSIMDLIMAPLKQQKREMKYRRQLGTD